MDERGPAGLTRAEVLKRGMLTVGGLGVGGSLLAACGGGGGGSATDASKTVQAVETVNGRLELGGAQIKPIGDEFVGPIFEWYGDDLEKEADVKVAQGQSYPFGDEAQSITPKLISNSAPPWNVVTYGAVFLGDFVATGGLEPLDPYLETFEGWADYQAGVTPVYREMYTKVDGKTYGLMMDGDCHTFHYRQSYYDDPTLQRAFRQQAGRELKPPRTWDEYVETATFFTKQLRGDGVYGAQIGTEPAVSWCYWVDIAGQRGLRYFDGSMTPQINSPEGVQSLEVLMRLAEACPPGIDNMSNTQTIANWQEGKVVQTVWWADMHEYNTEWDGGDKRELLVPGSDVNGQLVNRSGLTFCRISSVPSNLSDEEKRAAAWAAYRLSHPDYSVYSVSDPYCGLDPYCAAHFTRKAAVQLTKPNPLRKTTKEYPDNKGTFTSVRVARQHLDNMKASVQNGFPQPNWPGAGEYTRALGVEVQAAIAGQKSAKKAMDDAANAWSEIVEKRGKEEQQKFYASYLAAAQKLGL